MEIKDTKSRIKELIQKGNIKELENFIKEENILPENCNNYNEILIDSIENNASLEIIEFIIKQRQKNNLNFYINYYQTNNNVIKVPLFIAVANNNFKLSDLLIRYTANINYTTNDYNIITYLIESQEQKINSTNIKYILNNNFKRSNVTNELIFKLIKAGYNDILKIIISFYKRMDVKDILNIFLIKMYKNRVPFSRRELKNKICELEREIVIDDTMYNQSLFYNNNEAIRILFENDNSENNKLFIRIMKYDILDKSIQIENYDFLKKILQFKTFYYKYNNFKRKKLSLYEIIDNFIPRVIHGPKEITKLFIKIFLEESKNKSSENITTLNYNVKYLVYILNIVIKLDSLYFVKYLTNSEEFKLTKSDINTRDTNKEYPIVTALTNGNIEIFKYLLDFGADVNTKNNDDCSLLSLAINGEAYFIDYLLKQPNININEKDKWGNSSLLNSILKNNTQLVMRLLNYCEKNNIIVNINEKNDHNNYPILEAIEQNSIEIVKLLINYCDHNHILLNINEKDNNKNYPLLKAVQRNNGEIVKLLIEYCNRNHITLKTNEKDIHKNYPLLKAIQQNNVELTQLLIYYGQNNNILLNINENGSNKNYPLLEAIQQDNIELVQLLINYCNKNNINLNINEKNSKGVYPLLAAIYQNDISIVNLLIGYGTNHHILIDVNKKDYNENYPILEAIQNNNIDIVNLLIKYCNENNIIITINDKNDKGCFPLLAAVGKDNINAVELLINYANHNNLNLNIEYKYKDINEVSPLYLAIIQDNIEIIKLLLNYGKKHNIIFDINEKDEKGNCILLEAIIKDNVDMVKLLIDYSNNHNIILNINEKNIYGVYPLIMAIYRGNSDIVKILIDYCNIHHIYLDINQETEYGSFPLSSAIESGNKEIAKSLINYASEHNIIIKRYQDKKRRRYF